MTYREACAVLGLPTSRPAGQATRQPVTARGVVIPDCPDEAPPAEWQAAMSALVERCAANIPPAVMRYLREERGLSDETIRAHKVAGRWWVERGIIPTFYAGSLWRVNVRRRADDLRDGRGKYIAAQGSRAQLFGGDVLADAGIHAVVCAGEFDTMLAQQYAPTGLACVTFGSESKQPTWEFDYLTRDKRVLVIFDNDAAGEQYRQAIRRGSRAGRPESQTGELTAPG